MISLLRQISCAANFDFFRTVCFEPLQLDLQYPVCEARLDLIGIDPEGQLDGAGESAVSPLATLPVDVFLPGLRFALAAERQDVLLQVEIDVIGCYTRQLCSDHDAVFAQPDVDRRKVARGRSAKPGKQAVHLALHSPEFGKGVETQSGKF